MKVFILFLVLVSANMILTEEMEIIKFDNLRDWGNETPKSFVIQHKILERCPLPHHPMLPFDLDRQCKKIKPILFDTLEGSLNWLNDNPHVDLVGVYKLEKIAIEHKKMGTQKVVKDVPTEVEEDVMKWVIKE